MGEIEGDLVVNSREMQEINTNAFFVVKAESFQNMRKNGVWEIEYRKRGCGQKLVKAETEL